MFFRCTSLRSKYSSCQQLNNSTKENFILPPEQGPGNGTKHEPLILPLLPKAYSSAVSGMSIHWTIYTNCRNIFISAFSLLNLVFCVSTPGDIESCPSSPLFIPAKPEKKAIRRTRKQDKNSGNASTDNDEQTTPGIKEASEKKRRKGQSNQKRSQTQTTVNKREEKGQDSEGSEVSRGSLVTEKHQHQVASNRAVHKKQNDSKEQKISSHVQPMQPTQPTPTQQPQQLQPQPQPQPQQIQKIQKTEKIQQIQNKSSKVLGEKNTFFTQ